MHVAIINRHMSQSLGGSELQCDLLARKLRENDHDVSYLAVAGDGRKDDTPYKVIDVASDLRNLKAALGERQPDVIYWRYNKSHLLRSVCAAKSLGIPFVFGCAHDNDVRIFTKTILNDSPVRWRRLKQAYQMLYSASQYTAFTLVDGAIAQNDFQLRRLPLRNKVRIRNSYVDKLQPFDWPRPFISWVGTVKPSKRPEMFVELAGRCTDLNVDFLMVGPLADAHYEPMLEPNQTPDNFHYLGAKPYDEANGIIAASRFLVLTSTAEGFPNVLIQAWRNGLPTLTMSVDPDQLMETHEIGHRCERFANLQEKTRALATSPCRVEKMGRRANELAEREFNAEQNAMKFVTFFQRFI